MSLDSDRAGESFNSRGNVSGAGRRRCRGRWLLFCGATTCCEATTGGGETGGAVSCRVVMPGGGATKTGGGAARSFEPVGLCLHGAASRGYRLFLPDNRPRRSRRRAREYSASGSPVLLPRSVPMQQKQSGSGAEPTQRLIAAVSGFAEPFGQRDHAMATTAAAAIVLPPTKASLRGANPRALSGLLDCACDDWLSETEAGYDGPLNLDRTLVRSFAISTRSRTDSQAPCHGFVDDAIESRRKVRHQLRDRPRLFGDDFEKQVLQRRSVERLHQREDLIQHATDGEDVRSRAGLALGDLLGGHEGRRPEDGSGAGHAR